ncbi:MAG: zinc ribbon domain-containing protein [Caldilineaceae bacterium]|nr:zinc ribbon domain-containing protein [Caldilineaceae bacterium]
MSQKKLGLVELEWVCPNCGSRNPGPEKKCSGCGKPQPEDVAFVQPVDRAILTDAQAISDATRAPDIHCPYCNARNRADAKNCRNCGAPLAGGVQRKAGAVVGAYGDTPLTPIKCPACGTENPGDAVRCVRCGAGLVPGAQLEERARTAPAAAAKPGCSRTILLIGAGLFLLILFFFYLSTRTTATIGVVKDIAWERSVVVEALVPVRREAWLTEIPAGVPVGQCRSEVVRTQDEPTDNSVEVCGTPYTVDQGTGFGEVVQDCQYQVYADFCQYTVEEWKATDTLVTSGEGIAAGAWPSLATTGQQRPGGRSERYVIQFETDGAVYEYVVKQPEEAAAFSIGSRWSLEINTFGVLTDVEPPR